MTLLSRGAGDDTEPAWSPDGKRIAFVRDGTVMLMEATDGRDVPLPKPLQVTSNSAPKKLEFATDGRRLLGVFRTDATDRGLAWFDLATGDVQPLVPAGFYTRYALSPDGQWIAYTTAPNQPFEQSGNSGCYVDINKQAAAGGAPEQVCRFPTRIDDLCWADAKSLVIATGNGVAHDDLWKLPLEDSGRNLVKLTAGQADEDHPSLSRDGRWLTYSDNRDGATSIMIRNMGSGAENTVRIDAIDYQRPVGTLRLRVVDAATKAPTIARISLKLDGGRFHAPPGSLYRSLRGLSHFYCDQSTEWTLPAGTYHLRGFRGPEYRVATRAVTVLPGETCEVTVELERWIHMAQAGWWSGELHIHANYGYGNWFNTPATMRQQCVGEDLNVSNFMVANSDSDAVFDRPYFRGAPDPLSTAEYILYWNQEFRSTIWGHMTLVNLRQVVEPVFTGFPGTTNPWDWPSNAEIADRTHWQDGVVNYTHVAQAEDWSKTPYAAKAIPIDAALGKVDTLDINKTWTASVPLWHRLLNCGFRIPATAGTDVFLNRIASNLPGGDRVYVRVDGPLTYEAWIAGLKAGRSFVTNGPMLEFTVNGSESGTVLRLSEKPKIRAQASARSQFPLAAAELIHNGKVIATAALSDDKLTATVDQEITLDCGGWIAFRANGPGTPDTSQPTLNAHTNPVYVESSGMVYRSAEEATGFLRWIDQFEIFLRTRDRFPTQNQRQSALEQLAAAREVYARIVRATKE